MSVEDETALVQQKVDAEADSNPRQMTLFRVLELRIEAENKQTEAFQMMARLSDESDKRQFEYQMSLLNAQKEERDKNRRFWGKIFAWVGVFVASIFTLSFVMIFLAMATKAESDKGLSTRWRTASPVTAYSRSSRERFANLCAAAIKWSRRIKKPFVVRAVMPDTFSRRNGKNCGGKPSTATAGVAAFATGRSVWRFITANIRPRGKTIALTI